jgi:phage shock protein A
MFGTFKTLLAGASARADETLRDQFAIELIDQKIREAEVGLRAAKSALATLIQRQRSEQKLAETLVRRIDDLTGRVRAALGAGNDALAGEGAAAIAVMENELALRRETLARLEARVLRLTASVEAAHRRIIDLKQGAMQARTIRREQAAQGKLRGQDSSAGDDAQALIDRVLGAEDPVERADILDGITRGLSGEGLVDRMADAGFGPAPRATAATVLERLRRNN